MTDLDKLEELARRKNAERAGVTPNMTLPTTAVLALVDMSRAGLAMAFLFRCRATLHQGDDGFFFDHFGRALNKGTSHNSVASAATEAARELGWKEER